MDREVIEDHNQASPTVGGSAIPGIHRAGSRFDVLRLVHGAHLNWSTVLVIAILVVAASVRFYRLTGRSLWLDETVTAQSAHLMSAGDVIAQSQLYVNQAPLFYLITWLLRPWGDGEFILRLPAAIAGALAVLAIYLIGKQLFGPRGGLISALLMSLMPYAVWYSQEARNYALFMLLTTMQTYFAFTAVTRSRRLDWLGLALFTTLNLYTHYLALAATAGAVVYVALYLGVDILRGTSNRTKAVIGAVLAVAAVVAALVARRPVLKAIYLAGQNTIAETKPHPVYALAAGLAIAVAVVVFGAVLRNRSRHVKFTVMTSLIVALAATVVALRLTSSGSFPGASPLPVVAMAATIALALALAIALFGLDLLRNRPELAHKLEWAMVAAVLVALAYVPWLPYLRLAISRPDVTVGELHATHQPGLPDIVSFLDRLGISGFLLLLFVVGLVGIVVGLFRGRAAGSALLLSTLLIPVLVLALSAGPGIVQLDIRYLAFLFPTAMLVIAAGVEAATLVLGEMIRRLRLVRWPNPSAAAVGPALVLVALVLVQVLPALAASYQSAKQDYRSAAEHIVSNRPAPVLLSLGDHSDWSVITFGYYFNELHAPIAVFQGQDVTSNVTSMLASSTGTVWAVVIFPSAEQLRLLTSPGAAQTDFIDVTHDVYLVRAANPQLTPTQQVRELLDWEAPVEPQLRAVVKLMAYLDGQAQPGSNLVSDPTAGANGWNLPQRVAATGDALVMNPSAASPELDATTSVQIEPGTDYLVSFQYSNHELSGWQRVYVVVVDQTGHVVLRFPAGTGFECALGGVWTNAAFAFVAPEKASAVILVLAARGTGIAEFRALHLYSLGAGVRAG